MKDIGYYAGFLTEKDTKEIESANLCAMADLVSDLALSICPDAAIKPIQIDDFWLSTSRTERDKIALIRGLCDRIEIKLMEVAS